MKGRRIFATNCLGLLCLAGTFLSAPDIVAADTLDPFSPQSVAPVEPSALPRANLPTAPYVAPSPVEAPPLSSPSSVTPDTPLPSQNTIHSVNDTELTSPLGKEGSFLDSLTKIFDSAPPPEPEKSSQTPNVKTEPTIKPKAVETDKKSTSKAEIKTPEARLEQSAPNKTVEDQPISANPPLTENEAIPNLTTMSENDNLNKMPASAEPSLEMAKPPADDPGLLDQIGTFLSNAFGATEKKGQTVVRQDLPPAQNDKSEAGAPATEPTRPIDARLSSVRLGIGQNLFLGQQNEIQSPETRCLTKNRGHAVYCLTPTVWPEAVAPYFDITSHLYQGPKTIVQFDGDIATRMMTLFDGDGLENVLAYFTELLGPPTHIFERTTRTVKMGVIANPTYIWQKHDAQDGTTEILEIRKYTDIRGSIPDLNRSTLRVYYEGSREIFALTSDLDYMNLR